MSSALMTKIFCVANKHFMKFSVVRVNRAGDTRSYLDSMICPNGQNYCALQFFNEIMYVGIAGAKTEGLNWIVKLVLL